LRETFSRNPDPAVLLPDPITISAMSNLIPVAPVTARPPFEIAQLQTDPVRGSSLLTPVAQPAAADVTRFEGLLESGAATGATAPSTPPPALPVERGSGLGDLVLAGIDRMSSAYQQRVDAVNSTLASSGPEGLSSGEMMQLQFELTQMTLMQDLTAKVADKTSQGMQTLFKNQ